jgi:predicted nucleotidyltransferase
MEKIELHQDFKDFLRLLNSYHVEYLLVGGYAVGYHGYPRATGDMDIWVAISKSNAQKTAEALSDFGMPKEAVSKELFLERDKVIRMGVPPVSIEIITGASGVNFRECYARREVIDIDGIPVSFISLTDLKMNKRSAGRHKDLEDLDHLP